MSIPTRRVGLGDGAVGTVAGVEIAQTAVGVEGNEDIRQGVQVQDRMTADAAFGPEVQVQRRVDAVEVGVAVVVAAAEVLVQPLPHSPPPLPLPPLPASSYYTSPHTAVSPPH